jgi:hypothetical protein
MIFRIASKIGIRPFRSVRIKPMNRMTQRSNLQISSLTYNQLLQFSDINIPCPAIAHHTQGCRAPACMSYRARNGGRAYGSLRLERGGYASSHGYQVSSPFIHQTPVGYASNSTPRLSVLVDMLLHIVYGVLAFGRVHIHGVAGMSNDIRIFPTGNS